MTRPDLRIVPPDVSPMGMAQAVAHFLRTLDDRGAAINTVRSYGCDMKHYLDFLARTQFGDLVAVQSARTVARFIDDQTARGIGRRSQARRLSVLRAFFRHAKREAWIGHDPCQDERIRFRKMPVIAPELHELHTVIDAIPAHGVLNLRDRAILRLLLDTGVRISALCGLDAPGFGSPTGIDMQRMLVTYVGKGGDYQTKPFNATTARIVEAWLAVRSDVAGQGIPALFVTQRGQRITRGSLHTVIAKRGKAAGLHLHAHLLRHRRCAHVIETCDVKLAQQFMDHANIATTSEYGLRASTVVHGLLRERADIDAGRNVA